jgi:hypothetical protein
MRHKGFAVDARPPDAERLGDGGREIERFGGAFGDNIGVVDDEIRGLVARNWPHLLAKLPPED